MKFVQRPDRHPQRGFTLLEIMMSCLILGSLVGLVSLGVMNSFKLDSTQRGDDLNHFNFSRLTEAFYNDVHSSSALTSKSEKSIRLKKADGSGFVTYQIDPKAVKRGENKADTAPQQWEELTDSSLFAIASGSFAALKADGTSPAALQDVRRIDLKDLLATLNNNPQSKKLPLLTAILRSVPAPSPSPSAGPSKVYAILTGKDLTYSGNTEVRSTPTGKADVHANGNLTRIKGSSFIDGMLTYGGTENTNKGSHSGGIPTKAAPVKVPNYTATQLQSLANIAKASGNTNIDQANSDLARTPWQNGKRYATLKGYYGANATDKQISFGGVWEITVDGVVYIEGGLQMGETFVLNGNGLIICTEPIVTNGNSKIREGANPSDLALVSLSNRTDAIATSATSHITGILFAPNGGITMSGDTKITGCVIAGGPIVLGGNSVPILQFNANQSLAILQATY